MLDPDDPDLMQRAKLLTGRADAMLRLGDRTFDTPAKEAARAWACSFACPMLQQQRSLSMLGWPGRGALRSNPIAWSWFAAALDLDLEGQPAAHATLLVQLAQELLFLGDREERLLVGMRRARDPREWRSRARRTVRGVPVAWPGPASRQAMDDEIVDPFEAVAQMVRDHVDRGGTPSQRATVECGRVFSGTFYMDRQRFEEGNTATRQGARHRARQRLAAGLRPRRQRPALGNWRAPRRPRRPSTDSNVLATAQEDQTGTQYQMLVYFEVARERGRITDLIPFMEAVPLSETDAQGATAAVFACARATVGDIRRRRVPSSRRPVHSTTFPTTPDCRSSWPASPTLPCRRATSMPYVSYTRTCTTLVSSGAAVRSRTGGFYFGSLDSTLARVIAALGKSEDADALFQSGIADVDAFGARAGLPGRGLTMHNSARNTRASATHNASQPRPFTLSKNQSSTTQGLTPHRCSRGWRQAPDAASPATASQTVSFSPPHTGLHGTP